MMAIQNKTKREVPPTHPGEMLREDFMPDFDLNTTSMARHWVYHARQSMSF
jgi:plasmid maintenance system antidote protein VapI